MVDAIAERTGQPVTAYGHSYGGLCVFGAAPLTSNLGRIVLYEGWPSPDPQQFALSHELQAQVEMLLAAGEVDEVLVLILREVVGMTEPDIATYRDDPSWAGRVAAAPTFLREEEAFAGARWSAEAATRIRVPTLVLTGDQSPQWRAQADRVADDLQDARLVVLPGQGHGADLVAPASVAAALRAFLAAQEDRAATHAAMVDARDG